MDLDLKKSEYASANLVVEPQMEFHLRIENNMLKPEKYR